MQCALLYRETMSCGKSLLIIITEEGKENSHDFYFSLRKNPEAFHGLVQQVARNGPSISTMMAMNTNEILNTNY